MALSLATQQDRGWTVVRLAGEIDVTTAPRLRDCLAGAQARPVVVVDLTRVDFMDSAGLGVLAGALKRTRARGGTLRLVCPRRLIRDVLTGTGMAGMFRIHETLDGIADEAHGPPEGSPHGG